MEAELALRIAGGMDAPADTRAALRRFHPEVAPDLLQVVVLLASELVSNAVTHAGADSIAVRCRLTPRYVRVEVADEGPGFNLSHPAPTRGEVGGWGLYLVDEMSSRWGVGDGDGARVWFEIDR